MSTTQRFQATGLTCGHCARAVSEELLALDGVLDAEVEVVNGGAVGGHRSSPSAT